MTVLDSTAAGFDNSPARGQILICRMETPGLYRFICTIRLTSIFRSRWSFWSGDPSRREQTCPSVELNPSMCQLDVPISYHQDFSI